MLVFTRVYAPNGKAISNVLFYDASIEYFGREHLPYGIIAIVVTIFFNILPLLFTLIHPLRCFKQHIGRWPALHICLDSFQGCYKDGTAGTWDCRFFSSLFLLIHIALFIVYDCIKDVYYYPLVSILLLALVFLIILFQPFKPQFRIYNTIYTSIILNLAVWNVTIFCINIVALRVVGNISVALSTITPFLPLLYATYLFFKWFLPQKLVQYFCTKYHINYWLWRSTTAGEDGQEACLDDSFPHKMEHVINEEQPFPNYSYECQCYIAWKYSAKGGQYLLN